MSLHQLHYFFLLGLVAIIYQFFPKHRKSWLLLVSLGVLFFYNLSSFFSIIAVTWLTHWLANKGSKTATIIGVLINVGVFSLEKTLSIPGFSWQTDLQSAIWLLGMSFYVLQNIAYLIGTQRMPFSDLLLLNGFFPKLFAGPILNQNQLVAWELKPIEFSQVQKGIGQITFGLVKILVIADRLTLAVSSVFDYMPNGSGLAVYTGVMLFFIQLYFNFSGYVNIAIGSTQIFGIQLPENFNFSLRSKNTISFWQRWHITLLKWLGDYIYYPLAYRFRSHQKAGMMMAVMATFLLSGLWSGFEMKYVLTVSWFGFVIIIERLTEKWRKGKVNPIIGWLVTFHVMAIGFLFFRSDDVAHGWQILQSIFIDFWPQDWLKDLIAPLANGAHLNETFNWITSLLILIIALSFERKWQTKAFAGSWYLVLIHLILILLLGDLNGGQNFIYMQF